MAVPARHRKFDWVWYASNGGRDPQDTKESYYPCLFPCELERIRSNIF